MLILVCSLGALMMPPRLPPVDTVRARVVATIGEDAPRTPFMLGEVSGLAFDASARLYVADFQDPRVVIFDSTGRHLGTIGRQGEGPGEFTAPTGPVIAAATLRQSVSPSAHWARRLGTLSRRVRARQ